MERKLSRNEMERNVTNQVTNSDVKDLLNLFAENEYSADTHTEQDEKILEMCIRLWKCDYKCEILDNSKGNLCNSYPSRIVIPQYEDVSGHMPEESNNHEEGAKPDNLECHSTSTSSSFEKRQTETKMSDRHWVKTKDVFNLAKQSSIARCWNRFPVPAILYENKSICRSGTVACCIDVYWKKFWKSLHKDSPMKESISEEERRATLEVNENGTLYHTARLNDIKLLKVLKISSIIDLMVEKKKEKCLYISSSEKIDKENRYSAFSIYSLPYPGCEFFQKFSERHYNSESLYFDWNTTSPDNEAILTLPPANIPHKMFAKDWNNYKTWDLRQLTENYMRGILCLLSDIDSKETGLLVHCISGWDRTPLFISLLRLSLWADGKAHASLNSMQMLYLTLAYDWYLFGHQLPKRLSKSENILYFCFEFLEFIVKEKRMDSDRRRNASESSSISMPFEEVNAASLGSLVSLDESSNEAAETRECPSKTNFDLSNGDVSFHSSFKDVSALTKHVKESFQSLLLSEESREAIPSANVEHIPLSDVGMNDGEILKPFSKLSANSTGWPYDKENGFVTSAPSTSMWETMLTEKDTTAAETSFTHNINRSPLKQLNDSESHTKRNYKCIEDDLCSSSGSSSASEGRGKALAGHGRKPPTLFRYFKDPSRKSPRKNLDSAAKYTHSNDSVDLSQDGEPTAVNESNREEVMSIVGCATTTQPVPVPGVDYNDGAKLDMSGSIGSWQMVSNGESFRDCSSGASWESVRSRNSYSCDMVDSAHTIMEEATPSSSVGSSRGLIVFNRKQRLNEIRDLFYKLFGEVESLNQWKGGERFHSIVFNVNSFLSNLTPGGR